MTTETTISASSVPLGDFMAIWCKSSRLQLSQSTAWQDPFGGRFGIAAAAPMAFRDKKIKRHEGQVEIPEFTEISHQDMAFYIQKIWVQTLPKTRILKFPSISNHLLFLWLFCCRGWSLCSTPMLWSPAAAQWDHLSKRGISRGFPWGLPPK